MSSGCGDVLTLEDLKTAKKHQVFEAEVITGKAGGLPEGADIDFAVNPVTGQSQKTLPAVLRDAGFSPVSWDFSVGGVLAVGDRGKVVYDPVSKAWYSYAGTLPVTVPAGFNPVGSPNWKPQTDPTLRQDLAQNAQLVTLGYLGDSVESTFTALQSVPFEHFGGGSTKTGAENTAAFNAAKVSGFKHIWFNKGPYFFSGDLNFTGINDKVFESNTNAVLSFSGQMFCIKSPVNTRFKGITFYAPPSDGALSSIIVSNYDNISFIDCKFLGFGGDTVNKAGSCAIVMYAGDSATATQAAGSSRKGLFDRCLFDGLRDRLCNFAIRVYTEFTVSSASVATNSGNKIVNSDFVGHNWNAVEIAGPSTYGNIVSNCTATNPGLSPFDLDKGTHDNIIENITITNLLGDLGVSGFTRAAAVNVQGATSDTYYAYNNTVRNVVCTTTKSAVDAYNATGYGSGFTAVSLAYCYNNFVDNVTLTCSGGVPTKSVNNLMGLSLLTFETVSGNTVSRVSTVNASHGILMTAFKSQSMSDLTEPNRFSTFRNNGSLTGEIFYAYNTTAGSALKIVLSDIDLTTSGTATNLTYNSHNYAIVYRTTGSSVNYLRIEDSRMTIPTAATTWFAMCSGPQIGLKDVYINDGGTTTADNRFMESNGLSLITRIALENVYCDIERKPIQMQKAMLQLTGGVFSVVGGISDSGLPVSKEVTLFANSTTTFPSAAQYDTSIILRRTPVATGQAWGWVSTGSAWAALGSLA